MMLGEHHRPNPTVHVPPWALQDEDPTVSSVSPTSPLYLQEALKALHCYLPSAGDDFSSGDDHPDSPVDAYTCDHFRMYDFKVRRCGRGRSHDWTECPFTHPGEKARRRDPRKYHYSGTACPDFRKGLCKKGDACEYAHGVFECWLHPARYRTQPCKDGVNCRRRVCFFAHSPDQLRVLPGNQSNSPDSPPATPPAMDSPPVSPMMSRSLNEFVASLRNLQLSKVKSMPSSWGVQVGGGGSGFGSPRGSVGRPGFFSLPTTPTQVPSRGVGFWDRVCLEEEGEEEEVMERVESGRDIRKRMFEKLSKDNPLELATDPDPVVGEAGPNPDVGWVSDLLM